MRKNYPLTLLWGLFIFVLCTLKMKDIPQPNFTFEGIDKVVHFLFFLILSLIFVYETYRKQNTGFSRIRLSAILLLIGFVYGGGIELIQKFFFTYRSAEWLDLAADLAGSLLGIIIFNIVMIGQSIKVSQ